MDHNFALLTKPAEVRGLLTVLDPLKLNLTLSAHWRVLFVLIKGLPRFEDV